MFIFKESGDIATLGAEGADLSAKMVVAVGRDPKNVINCCQLVQQNNQDEPLSTFKLQNQFGVDLTFSLEGLLSKTQHTYLKYPFTCW